MNKIKWAWQRLVRGYDDRLFWSLADYIDPLIVAHVRFLREEGLGFPTGGLTQKKWHTVLDTILAGLDAEQPDASSKQYRKSLDKYLAKRNKALVLLAYYWDNFWD